MKPQLWCSLVSLAFGGLILAGCASSSNARFEDDRWWYGSEARVEEVRGKVEFSEDGSEWIYSFRGQPIRQGNRLRTGENSEARVSLGEDRGGWVRVLPGSNITFEQLDPATEGSDVGVILNLPQGRVVGDTARTSQGKKILVKTPNGTHEITADGE